MIQHYIKCEMCDNKHEIAFLYKAAVWRELPHDWITLFSTGADATANDGWNLCSDKCLIQWVTGNVIPVFNRKSSSQQVL